MDLWRFLAHDSGMVIGFSTLFVSIYFLNRLRSVRKTTREILPFVGITLLFFAATISFFAESYRHALGSPELGVASDELNILLYGIQFLAILGTVGFFGFLTEYVAKKTKYILSLYVLIEFIIGVYLTLTATDTDILALYSIIASLPIIFGLILWYFVFIKPSSDLIRRRMIFAMMGMVIVATALILRSRLGNVFFGDFSHLAGNIIALGGVLFVWYGFSALETVSDLGWKVKLRELFVISKNGIALYAFSFEQNISLQDSDLIASGFSGIQALLSEMVKTEESLTLINYHNLKILVEQVAGLMFVLVLKEESSYLKYKLRRFSEAFQDFFQDVLTSWHGETDIFIPTKSIIQQVFEIGGS